MKIEYDIFHKKMATFFISWLFITDIFCKLQKTEFIETPRKAVRIDA